MKYTLSLKDHKRFTYTIKKGKFSSQKFLTMYISNNHNQCNFLGICVSKKNGNSICRNKLKRWCRESYKYQENLIKKGFNIVIIYKKTTLVNKTNYKLIDNDMIAALKNLGLYEN